MFPEALAPSACQLGVGNRKGAEMEIDGRFADGYQGGG